MNKFFLFLSFFLFLYACKKTPEPIARKPFTGFRVYDEKFFVDSLIGFENYSDTTNITYLWEFGDGDKSTVRHPYHSYKKRGNYTIKLTATNKEGLSETFTKDINVSIGEKIFYHDPSQQIMDLAETADGNFIIIGYSRLNPTAYQSFIAKHDDQLRFISLKKGVGQQKIWIRNIEPTDDDGFIIAGNFLNSNGTFFSLTKINKGGDVIWTKDYNQGKGFIKEVKKVNDGFILIGEEPFIVNGNTIYYTVVIKTNFAGQELWGRHFNDEKLLGSGNIVGLNDAYIFSSYKPNNLVCSNCRDTLVITKLNISGDVVWMKRYYFPEIFEPYARTAFSNNKFISYNNGSNVLRIFSEQGDLVFNIPIPNLPTPKLVFPVSDGIFVAGAYNFNGDHNFLQKYHSQGIAFARSGPEKLYGVVKDCPSNRGYVINMKPTQDGNYIYLGLSLECGVFQTNNPTLLFKIDKDGIVL